MKVNGKEYELQMISVKPIVVYGFFMPHNYYSNIYRSEEDNEMVIIECKHPDGRIVTIPVHTPTYGVSASAFID